MSIFLKKMFSENNICTKSGHFQRQMNILYWGCAVGLGSCTLLSFSTGSRSRWMKDAGPYQPARVADRITFKQ